MKIIYYVLLFCFVLSLSACWNNNSNNLNNKKNTNYLSNKSMSLNTLKHSKYTNMNKVNNYSYSKDLLLKDPIIKNNMDQYIELEKQAQIPKVEKDKILNEIKVINTDLDNKLWVKINTFSLLNAFNFNKKEINKLEELNKLLNKALQVKDNELFDQIKKEKKDIFNQLKNKWFTDNEIKALDKLTALPDSQKNKIIERLNKVSKNLIVEAGWKIVSSEFKEKYDEAKQEILELNKKKWVNTGNWLIPYNIVIEYMIKKELINSWQCDKLDNPMERADCEFKKRYWD